MSKTIPVFPYTSWHGKGKLDLYPFYLKYFGLIHYNRPCKSSGAYSLYVTFCSTQNAVKKEVVGERQLNPPYTD
jgi:hypothetical protein